MEKLSPNWITEGLLDYEYKKYILLGYLQDVSKNFNENKLYPFLSDVIDHYNNLITLKHNKTIASNQFPKQLSKIDFENFKLVFERMSGDNKYLEEVESILNFALPALNEQMKEGKELYMSVEEKLNIFPVGIVPITSEVGYMLLSENKSKETKVYEYEITIFENVKEKYRGIKTQYLTSYRRSFTNTFEKIKIDLLRTYKKFGNPGTYVVESKLSFPLNETLLPVAKRSLVRFLYKSVS